MSGSVNKVFLVGRVGADAEIRNFENGGKVATFSVATSDTWKDKSSGDKKERTEWSKIAVLNDALAEVCGKYVKKGSLVSVIGKLETRDYQKDGVKHYVTEVVLRPYDGELTLLGDKKDDATRPDTNGQGRAAKREPRP